jgi:phosphopantetheine adenylyltransferase
MAAEMAIAIEEIIGRLKRRDWQSMEDVMKDMQNAIDDYLFEVREKFGITFTTSDMDAIIERCLSIAKKLAGG